jgi:hypothetical protein
MICPVGLFQFVADRAQRKREIRCGRHLHDAAAGRAHEDRIHFKGRRWDNRLRQSTRALHDAKAADGCGEQAFVEPVGQHELRLAHAEIFGALAR